MQTLPGPDPFSRPNPNSSTSAKLRRIGAFVLVVALAFVGGAAVGGAAFPVQPRMDQVSLEEAQQRVDSAENAAEVETVVTAQLIDALNRMTFLASCSYRFDDRELESAVRTALEVISDEASNHASAVGRNGEERSGK